MCSATHLILQPYTLLWSKAQPFPMEEVAFGKGWEPEHCAQDDNHDSVEEEEVVENDKTDSDMVGLNDCANGDRKRYE